MAECSVKRQVTLGVGVLVACCLQLAASRAYPLEVSQTAAVRRQACDYQAEVVARLKQLTYMLFAG